MEDGGLLGNPFLIESPYNEIKTLADAEKVSERVAKHLGEKWSSPPTNRDLAMLEHLYLSSVKKVLYSAFFSIDLRGFTTLSYSKKARELSQLITNFSSSLSSIVSSSGGYVLKYIGDAVLAFYPTKTLEESINRALFTAYTTWHFMRNAFLDWADNELGIKTNFGMGIDAGEVAIVKLGSPSTKISYDLIGKPINVSVKLQSLAEDGQTMVTEIVSTLAKEPFHSAIKEYTPPDTSSSIWSRLLLAKLFKPAKKGKKVKLPSSERIFQLDISALKE